MASMTRQIRKRLCATEAQALKIHPAMNWLLSYSQSAYAARVRKRALKAAAEAAKKAA